MTIEKIYMGISLGFNSSACVYSTTRGILAAISQERLNGQKNTKELPLEAALKCCKITGVNCIHKIAISHYETITDEYFMRYGDKYDISADTWENAIINYLSEYNVDVKDKTIARVPHHVAHTISTLGFYDVPRGDDYAITSDEFGDGYSGVILKVGEEIALSDVKLENSIALVYQFVTGALGYKEHQHEGKITGLAAFGEPKYLTEFESLYDNCDYGNFIQFKSEDYELTDEEQIAVEKSAIVDFDKFLKLKKAVYGLVNRLLNDGAEPKDIAATVQEFAEIHTLEWIRRNIDTIGKNCYLAGGLFANVKINQRIKDMTATNGERLFNNVYVCPAMGDEGTAIGAAIVTADSINIIKVSPNQCGTIAHEATTLNQLRMKNYKVTRIALDDALATKIAQKLADNKIVCLVKGRMEFGPRALCHRSILYNCNTKETNTWLNDKLGRTEFMPFAPVCREEVADDLFLNLDGGRDSAKHMTMTFDCTDEFIQNYPAACHIDNTARPQIVSVDEDPFIWSVLDNYQNITGKKALINTSFNLHNNPIIESTEVAISSWLKSDTDILVIGNIMVEKP